MYPGFVLIRYDKIQRQKNYCHEGRKVFILTDPLKRKHGPPHRGTRQESTRDNQEAERAKGKESMGQKEWMSDGRQTEHIQDWIV